MFYLLLGLAAYVPLWLSAPYRPDVFPFLLCLPAPIVFLFWSRREASRGKLGMVWLLATALVLRLLFLVQAPSLSEDIYRYFWDGFLVSKGESPYLHPPQELAVERAAQPLVYSRMAHRDRRSVYPPVAEGWFWLGWTLWGASPGGWKLLALLVEGGLFCLFLKGFRTSPGELALWALHPLPIVEFYSSGHVDILAVTLFLGSLYLLTRESSFGTATSGALLAGSALVKVFPVFALPLGFGYLGRKRGVWLAAGFLIGGLALSLPLVWALGAPIESMTALTRSLLGFNAEWRFNSLPFFLLKSSRRLAGRAASAVFVALALWLAWRQTKGNSDDLKARLYFLLASLLGLVHTVHPWYVSWLLVLQPLLGGRYWAGLYLSLACMASYLAYGLDPPGERLWYLWLEWLPYYFLLARDVAAYHEHSYASKASLRDDPSGG